MGTKVDPRHQFVRELTAPLRVKPGRIVDLAQDFDPGYTGGLARNEGESLLAEGIDLLTDYQAAFGQMLSHTSTEWAPWYVVPADHKWFTRMATAAVLVQTLVDIDPHYPQFDDRARSGMAGARAALEADLA